jgi:glycosyltransferase involved in cell wall biosynthesis
VRVAYITHYAELYGANLSLLDILLELRQHGVQPLVILPVQGPFEVRLRALGIAVEIVLFEPWMSIPHASGRWYHRWMQRWQLRRAARARAFRNRVAARAINALLDAHRIELLHANSVVVGVVHALVGTLSVPLVWHIRELPGAHYGLVPDVGRFGYQRALNAAAAIIAISPAVQRDLIQAGVRQERMNTIADGVFSAERLKELRRTGRRLEGNGPFTFVQVGLVHPRKGQWEALAALRMLRDKGVHARLIIAGDGRVEALGEEVKRCGLEEQVELLGYVEDVHAVFARAHAALTCSRHEALGRSTIEAMLNARPVIGHRSGATPDLIKEGVTGLLYDQGAEDLAGCMERLIDDPQRTADMGVAALNALDEAYTQERSADAVLTLYRSLAAKG